MAAYPATAALLCLRRPRPSSLVLLPTLSLLSSSLLSPLGPPLPPLLSLSSSLRPLSSSTLTQSHPTPPPQSLPHPSLDLDDEDAGGEEDEDDDPEASRAMEPAQSLPRLPCPNLSVKEKEELASYAHSLGKKLKSQQVGKSGVTPSVAASFVETLEANELLKLKVHGSCPGELSDVIKQLEESTGSVAVGQIGRSVILYRPSLSKMKKKEAQSARSGGNARSSLKSATPFKVQKSRQVSTAHQRR